MYRVRLQLELVIAVSNELRSTSAPVGNVVSSPFQFKKPEATSAGGLRFESRNSWLPTLDNLHNFLWTPTKEMLSFLAAVDISLNASRTTAGYVKTKPICSWPFL